MTVPGGAPPAGFAVRPFDTAATTPRFLVEGEQGKRWQVNEPTAQLLIALRQSASVDEAARIVAGQWGVPVPPEQLARYIEQVLVPMGLVGPPPGTDASTTVPPRPRGRLGYMSYRRTIVRAAAVARASRVLAPLYEERFFWMTALAAFTAAIWVFVGWALLADRRELVRQLDIVLAPATVLLALASSVLHELGHAAAARRFGCRHGDLGFGLYLVFPVLYMELDDAWRLPRGQRAIIDAGGLHLQLVFALAIAGAAAVWHPLLPSAMGLMILTATSIITNLNPLFRFDGYWMVSDLLGIANLRQTSQRAVASLGQRAWRRLGSRPRAGARQARAPELPRRTAALLLVYGIASVGFFVEYFRRLFLALPMYARDVYPRLAIGKLHIVANALEHGDLPRAVAALLTLIPPTALLVGLTLTGAMIVFRSLSLGARMVQARTKGAG